MAKREWKIIDENAYRKEFGIVLGVDNVDDNDSPQRSEKSEVHPKSSSLRARNALDHALDIRKFEISLYWQRASYFWAFIAVAFAGYVTLQSGADSQAENNSQLSLLIASLGIVFSFAWVCANHGSKQWQENWENHVDLLEDDIHGPLYKTVLITPSPIGCAEKVKRLIWGPHAFSVSKINQIVSLFVVAALIWKALKPLYPSIRWADLDGIKLAIAMITIIAVLLISRSSTDQKNNKIRALRRASTIVPPEHSGSPDVQ